MDGDSVGILCMRGVGIGSLSAQELSTEMELNQVSSSASVANDRRLAHSVPRDYISSKFSASKDLVYDHLPSYRRPPSCREGFGRRRRSREGRREGIVAHASVILPNSGSRQTPDVDES